MPKEIYIIRHGETDLNRQGIVQGSGVDPSLNNTGRQQAESFFRMYHQHPFELVITSTLRRSRETVQSFIDLPLPWMETPQINEISWGDHEGRPSEPWMVDAYQKMIARWAEGDLSAHLNNGESAAQLIRRMDQFLEELVELPHENILVCTHGRALRCLVTRIQNLPPIAMESVEHKNTGLYLVTWDDGQFTVQKENDIAHLQYA
ncbi:MAG: histidine phosphatase family protein [Saprospiraceae bacterium]|nr:histidine phosphatase family protein [Lewinellaceae bacterium]HRW76171.1 histidine phosphatase family protein [Saprospiraceae bacterium]